MKIVMYGSGAAGSVFASFLRGGGADMVLVDRYKAHMEKVAADGMYFTVHQQVNGEYQDETRHLTGFRTYTDAESAAKAEGKADIIIYMIIIFIEVLFYIVTVKDIKYKVVFSIRNLKLSFSINAIRNIY